MSTILCFSGGLDSLAAYYYLGRPRTVYFDYGGGYCKKELTAVKSLVPDTIIDKSLELYKDAIGPNAYIPYRNLLFALRAAKYGHNIIIAGIKDDVVADKSPHAFNVMTIAMQQLDTREVTVTSPFWEFTKEDIVKYLLAIPNGIAKIMQSTSCYHPTMNFCGKCPSCFRKACAVKAFGIELNFTNVDMVREYLQRAREGKYILERNNSIIRYATDYLDKINREKSVDPIQRNHEKVQKLKEQWGKPK